MITFKELIVRCGEFRKWNPTVLLGGRVLVMNEVLIPLSKSATVENGMNSVWGSVIKQFKRKWHGMGVEIGRVMVRFQE